MLIQLEPESFTTTAAYWGEPERAPHRRELHSQSILLLLLLSLLSYVRHPRAAPYTMYSGRTRRHGVDNF